MMEKKYIEVNELLKSFTPDCPADSSNKPIKIDLRLIKRIITRQPIADVKEVKHGKWRLESDEEMPNFYFKLVVCSVCGEKASGTYSYCPHCGADMRTK